jgi:hypothetical protein
MSSKLGTALCEDYEGDFFKFFFLQKLGTAFCEDSAACAKAFIAVLKGILFYFSQKRKYLEACAKPSLRCSMVFAFFQNQIFFRKKSQQCCGDI